MIFYWFCFKNWQGLAHKAHCSAQSLWSLLFLKNCIWNNTECKTFSNQYSSTLSSGACKRHLSRITSFKDPGLVYKETQVEYGSSFFCQKIRLFTAITQNRFVWCEVLNDWGTKKAENFVLASKTSKYIQFFQQAMQLHVSRLFCFKKRYGNRGCLPVPNCFPCYTDHGFVYSFSSMSCKGSLLDFNIEGRRKSLKHHKYKQSLSNYNAHS